jgi:cytoplasmic iron level regulating protein YaaA (DUF328/UPF0246 family)
MRIIISPSKRMKVNEEDFPICRLPVFLEKSEELLSFLKKKNLRQLKDIWKCSDKIAFMNHENLKTVSLTEHLTPAILAYTGLQYTTMGPHVFSKDALDYIQKHLRIISGFYGTLAPFDGIVPYRLEMKAALDINENNSLYDFWGKMIYDEIIEDDHLIINLASKEYAQTITPYLHDEDQMITLIFGEEIDGKIKQKGTFAKMARGEMVRYLAENNIQNKEDIKAFNELDYRYSEEHSNDHQYVFIK